MKIFKMIRGFFLKRNRSYKIMQNVIFRVKLLSPTLKLPWVRAFEFCSLSRFSSPSMSECPSRIAEAAHSLHLIGKMLIQSSSYYVRFSSDLEKFQIFKNGPNERSVYKKKN